MSAASSVLGLDDDSFALLAEHDAEFYGSDTDVDVTSAASSDFESSDDEPATQRSRLTSASSEEEYYSPAEDEPLSDHGDIAAGLAEARLNDLLRHGCGCRGVNHYDGMSKESIETFMVSLDKLNRDKFKQFVLGELTACILPASGSGARRKFKYKILSYVVCQKVFLDVHNLHLHTLKALQKLVEESSAFIPQHGAVDTAPHRSLPGEAKDAVIQFIRNYGNRHGLPQPAAPRGRPGYPPVYLPASHKKGNIHEMCLESLNDLNFPVRCSYRTFRRIWKVHAPEVQVMKRRTDVCCHCDQLRECVRHARTEAQTKTATDNLAEHLSLAEAERAYYKSAIQQAKSCLEDDSVPPISHVTFDFAQQLELPCHTRQVGPLYFKVGFRVQLFGVCQEAYRKQANYLFSEKQCIGEDGKKAHGPNAVISMLHHYFANNPVSPTLHLHADNCTGQNKNKSVLAYLMWRCLTGHSSSIELSFMRVGHTRCSVDGYFGLIKQKWRSTENDTMDDVKHVVNESCNANTAVMFDWTWREWDTHLSQFFKPIPGIMKYHHFVMSSDDKDHVFCRKTPTDEPFKFRITRGGVPLPNSPANLPRELPPAGLSQSRQEYLENQLSTYFAASAQTCLPWK